MKWTFSRAIMRAGSRTRVWISYILYLFLVLELYSTLLLLNRKPRVYTKHKSLNKYRDNKGNSFRRSNNVLLG